MKLKDNIKNNYTKYIIGLFVIISTILISYILFKNYTVGVADQGDFDRVMSASGLSLLDSDKMNPDFKRFYEYIVTDYKINPSITTFLLTLVGSSMNYLITAISYICKLLGQDVFRTQYLAIVYSVIYISSIALILKSLNIKSKLKLTILTLVSIFIFMDGNYILWFNSLYGEPMMLSTLLLFLATFLYYINCRYVKNEKEKIASKICLVYIAGFMFLGSKMQVFTTLPFVVILLGKILWDNRNVMKRKSLILLSIFLAVIVIYPVQINLVNRNIGKDTQYNSVFYGVLNGSETPEQDLIDLGINPDMAVEAGKHSYLDPSEYVKYVPRTEITEQEFYSKIGNGKLAKFYLTHPKRLIEGMQYTASKAFITSTGLGKAYRSYSEEPITEFHRFTTWSKFRESKLPTKLWFILGIIISVFIVSIIKFVKNKDNEEVRNKIFLLWGLILIGGIQFPMPFVGNGRADTAKQLYLFNFVFDILLVISVLWIVFKLIDFIMRNNIVNTVVEKFKYYKEKIFSSNLSKFRFFTVVDMLLKSVLFMTLIEVGTADKIDFARIAYKFILVYLAFILLFYALGYLFSKNKQIIYCIVLNVLFSFLLIGDLWYYRVNRDFFGLKNIFFPGTFNPVGNSLFQFKMIDLLFIVDLIVIIAFVVIKKIKCNESRSIKKFSITMGCGVAILVISFICIDLLGMAAWADRILIKRWSTLMSSRASGPIGYHLIEAGRTLSKLNTPSYKEEIEDWLEKNKEDLEPNEYKGIAKGKNVIFLQIESLENFVINKSTNGKEISPFMNKLAREGLYFTNIYEQNNAANSIDCDLMVNTSLYPLGDKITALNYGENVYYNSLSRLLESEGYTTISTHAEEYGDFNWTELHKNGFGSNLIWGLSDYIYEETVGYGLSDRSFLTQISDKLKNIKEPFFIQAPTLSNHGPFNIGEEYRELNLPKEVDESYLGGYFESVRYTDNQVEMFFNKLDEMGILDNTMIVLYGDHGGVHKYYDEDIKDLDYEGNWWKEYDKKIPLIIYSKGINPKIIETTGGQTDILPTVSYLLGIDEDKYLGTSMGRVLVNTNRDAIIIKGNEVKGNAKNEEELQHLLKSYEIGDKIIKSNYFGQKKVE